MSNDERKKSKKTEGKQTEKINNSLIVAAGLTACFPDSPDSISAFQKYQHHYHHFISLHDGLNKSSSHRYKCDPRIYFCPKPAKYQTLL